MFHVRVAIFAVAGKDTRTSSILLDVTRGIGKGRVSRVDILLASCAKMEKNKRIGPTTKGNKRITTSQLPEEDPDLELLFHEKLQTSPALSSAKVLFPPSHCDLLYVLFVCECQLVVVMLA